MCAQQRTERRSARVGELFTWLGGGHSRELGERHERSAHAVGGAVVLFGAVLAWLVSSVVVSESAHWPVLAIVPFTLLFGLLVGAVTRGTAIGTGRTWPGVAGRAAVAAAVGVVVGELTALALLSSSIDQRLDERALRDADSVPAVAQASASLQQTRAARDALDAVVDQARQRQDKALVVARCEYHPTPDCPQTRITGVPGAGPETRTANELLADAQQELDKALAARERQAPKLDAAMSREQQAVSAARRGVLAAAGRGFGARWVAMNELTSASIGALLLRLLTLALCVLLYLVPLVLGLWRGETSQDRRARARAERDRAEIEADTAVAIKRAEVRREAQILWAEHQLTQARLAIEAQTEIDREHQRRRVLEAFDAPLRAASQRPAEPVEEMYLPIAAEAEAASLAATQLPGAAPSAGLPAPVASDGDVEPHRDRGTPLIPSIPDATRAAARWIRPLVPPVVARVIDTTTAPLRTARHVFEEVEEITFALRRTRTVTITETPSPAGDFVESSRADSGRRPRRQVDGHAGHSSLPLGPAEYGERELTTRDGPSELRSSDAPRELPPPG